MLENSDSLSGLCERFLRLSINNAGERVCLLTIHQHDPEIARGLLTALMRLEADTCVVHLPARSDTQGWANPLPAGSFAQNILKQADLVVRIHANLSAADINIYTKSAMEVLQAGVRWLDVHPDQAMLRRLFPSQAMIERTKSAAGRLAAAEVIRLRSAGGTDLVVKKGGRKGHAQMGVADEPGRWDKYGFGLAACAPQEDGVDGVLVFDVGDSLGLFLGVRYNLLPEPVHFHFEKGQIVRIEGGKLAGMYAHYLAQLGRPEHYCIAHLGWGTNEKAVWGGPSFTVADWESYLGSVMVHLGHNTFNTPCRTSGYGGANAPTSDWPMPVHSGGVVLNHDLWLDDEKIIEQGQIVALDLK